MLTDSLSDSLSWASGDWKIINLGCLVLLLCCWVSVSWRRRKIEEFLLACVVWSGRVYGNNTTMNVSRSVFQGQHVCYQLHHFHTLHNIRSKNFLHSPLWSLAFFNALSMLSFGLWQLNTTILLYGIWYMVYYYLGFFFFLPSRSLCYYVFDAVRTCLSKFGCSHSILSILWSQCHCFLSIQVNAWNNDTQYLESPHWFE
jgi:hypothetical protein